MLQARDGNSAFSRADLNQATETPRLVRLYVEQLARAIGKNRWRSGRVLSTGPHVAEALQRSVTGRPPPTIGVVSRRPKA